MKYISQIIAAFATIVVVSSCGDEYLHPEEVESGTAISVETVDVYPGGQDFPVVFTANTSWTLNNVPDWLHPSVKSGSKGTTEILFQADVNKTGEDRSTTVVFSSSKGSFSTPLSITQEHPYFKVDKDDLQFDWMDSQVRHNGVVNDSKPEIITISTNLMWVLIEEENNGTAGRFDHFALSALSGEDSHNLEVIPQRENFSKAPYELAFRVQPVYESDNGYVALPKDVAESHTVRINQKNLRFLINDEADDVTVVIDEFNSDSNINLSIDSELAWSIDNCPSWIKLSKKSGSDITSVNVQADGVNPGREDRVSVLQLSTKEGATREITIKQKGFRFNVSNHDVHVDNDDTQQKSFSLSSSGEWTISSVPAWLTVSPTSGTGDATIQYAAKTQNLNTSDNQSTLKITSKSNGLVEEVEFVQDKFVFDVAGTEQLADIPTISTTKFDVVINSSGEWELAGIPTWLEVDTQKAGKGRYSVRIGPKSENSDQAQDRTATLSLISVTHKNAGKSLTKTISVKQRKYIFEVSASSFPTLPAYSSDFSSLSGYSASIKCSGPWTVSYPDWLIPDIKSGDGKSDVTVRFTAQVNTTKSLRSGNVEIKNTRNNQIKRISVSQEAFVFDNSSLTYDVAAIPVQTYPVSFNLTDGTGWSISSMDSWISSSSHSGTGNGSLVLTVGVNDKTSNRSGSVIIRSSVSGETKTIIFNQRGYSFDSESEDLSFTAKQTSEGSVNIKCSGEWKTDVSANWIKVSPSTGKGDGQVRISVDKNTTKKSRTGTVTVSSKDNPNMKKVITVKQSK